MAEANVTVSAQRAEEFARRLASDDAFRAKLQSDPVGALRELGVELPRGTTIDPATVVLPSKEEAAAEMQKMTKFTPVFGLGCPIQVS
jgi:putative modified peptide